MFNIDRAAALRSSSGEPALPCVYRVDGSSGADGLCYCKRVVSFSTAEVEKDR